MLDPFAAQQLAREAVADFEKKLADRPVEFGWRWPEFDAVRKAVNDDEFRDLVARKIRELNP